jgi:glucokinase
MTTADDDLILALDFGGTKHTAGLAQRGERAWLQTARALAPERATAEDDLSTMFGLAEGLLAGRRPDLVGVSFGGPVDFFTGVVRLSHHVPGWENRPLAQMLADKFGAPVWVDNDANVAAIGEHRFGAGQGCDSLLYMTVSTGVGGGWILNGRPWRGGDRMAGEIGHMVVDPAGPECVCGNRGCVERLASGTNIARQARAWLSEQPQRGARLREIAGGNMNAVDAKAVAEAAAQGDALAWEALAGAARALGVGIGNAANLINPQRFVLGGGVTKSGDRWWQAVRAAARATALPEVQVDIVPATLGDEAPLWGAVALALGSQSNAARG